MNFPMDFQAFILWLGMMAAILLITTSLLSQGQGTSALRINKKRLRNVAYVFSFAFLVAAILGIVG